MGGQTVYCRRIKSHYMRIPCMEHVSKDETIKEMKTKRAFILAFWNCWDIYGTFEERGQSKGADGCSDE